MADKPDIIQIVVEDKAEVAADHAHFLVTIRGVSGFTGQAALNKAREVAALVAELKRFGVEDSDITLEGVRADVSSGTFGKTSSASYDLKIRCGNLEQLPDLLGAITGQKNTSMRGIVWGYGDTDAASDQLLIQCLQKANAQARLVAQGLGVRLLGVHRFSEIRADEAKPQAVSRGADFAAPAMMRGRTVDAEELGMEVSHSKTIELRIVVEYHISGFEHE